MNVMAIPYTVLKHEQDMPQSEDRSVTWNCWISSELFVNTSKHEHSIRRLECVLKRHRVNTDLNPPYVPICYSLNLLFNPYTPVL